MTYVTDMARVPPSTLGNRLRESREWRGLDQTNIAEALGKSRQTISNYERGFTRPGKLELNAWAAHCDVDVEWLKSGNVYQGGDGGGAKSRPNGYLSGGSATILPFPVPQSAAAAA